MMQVEADRRCFVCGPENPIGLKVAPVIDAESRCANLSVTPSEHYQGWQGVVHGGIISALLDETAIYACRPISPHAVTASLNIKFRKPVSVGREVAVTAQVTTVRRNVAIVESVLSQDDVVMAEAEVKVILLEKKGEMSDG